LLQIAALLVTVTALFAYVNHRWIRLPTTMGVMAISLAFSLAIVALGRLGFSAVSGAIESLFRSVNFDQVLMQGMLSLLLFAGALSIDVDTLADRKVVIALLASGGLVVSTVLVGAAAWFVFALVGIAVPLAYCLVFGALISPTDPIAVLGILKSAGVPRSLEGQIAGESIFNDGVAVVVFAVATGIATGATPPQPGHVALLLAEEALGGVAYGLVIGAVAYLLLKSIDNYEVEVLITLALVLGGYALASVLGVSGPLAMVVSGLIIGNRGRAFAMSETTRQHLDTFWELVDVILNAVLFVMIGFEVVTLTFEGRFLVAALLMIPVVILARFLSVGSFVALLRRRVPFSGQSVKVVTWAGVRGGISVALALSLRPGPERELLVFVTYAVVVFSILVQGLSVGWLVRRVRTPPAGAAGDAA
jgi:CPA1 family monovalent cation:H+ antiporter